MPFEALSKMNSVQRTRLISKFFSMLKFFVKNFGTNPAKNIDAYHYLDEIKRIIQAHDITIRRCSLPEVEEIPMYPYTPEYSTPDYESAHVENFSFLYCFFKEGATNRGNIEAAHEVLHDLYSIIKTQENKIRHCSLPQVQEITMCPYATEFTRRDYESGYVEYNPITCVLKIGGERVVY